jgi:3-deoxy-D-manno-octulosonic acid (KDO) 8-phosphate synthase
MVAGLAIGVAGSFRRLKADPADAKSHGPPLLSAEAGIISATKRRQGFARDMLGLRGPV